MTKKEFCLKELAPYYKDPSTCGYNESIEMCVNLTKDGRMCVAGKNLLPEKRILNSAMSIDSIFMENDRDQSKIFIPEVVGILTNYEWTLLQQIHDAIATKKDESILKVRIYNLNLFSLEELKEYICDKQ